MLSREIIIKRLALIKYLYNIGTEQSKQVEPYAGFSVLSFHDSIEMFLKLAAEHKNVKSDKLAFMEYWEKMPQMTLAESMKTLNIRRVNIKHKGLLPSKTDIEISRLNATEFFEQNTPIIFGLEFKNISLFSLIQNATIRDALQQSQAFLSENKTGKCIEFSAIAFAKLLDNYEENKQGIYNQSHFNFGYSEKYRRICFGVEMSDRKIKDFARATLNVFESLQRDLKIISLGIDYRRYVKFKLLTPLITRMMNGEYIAELIGEKKWSRDNCQYCIDFVVESTLKIQEFDFDIKDILNEEFSIFVECDDEW